MADRWRNRFLAPVYALVISFVLIVILGYALNDPTWIQFKIAGQDASSQLPREFWDFKVRVDTDDGEKTLFNETLGRSGEFTLLNPHQEIRICTKLPDGWFARGATVVSEESCLVLTAPGKEVMITLAKEG